LTEALVSIALHRLGATTEAEAALKALMTRAVDHSDLGLHWKDAYGDPWRWEHAPVEAHAAAVEAVGEVKKNDDVVRALCVRGILPTALLCCCARGGGALLGLCS
jgi:hypothetical protein